MKLFTAIAVLCFVSFCFSQTSIADRARDQATVLSQIPPFGFSVQPDVSSNNWVCPDSVWIGGIYMRTFGNVKMKLRGGDTLTMPIDSLQGLPLDISVIYSTGTDAGVKTGKIILLGRKMRN